MARQKARDEETIRDPQDAAILDALLDRLRNGDTMPRKARRTRPSVHRLPASLALSGRPVGSESAISELGVNGSAMKSDDSLVPPVEVVADRAKDMLAELQQAGFGGTLSSPGLMSTLPRTPRAGAGSTRRTRARAEARASASNLRLQAEDAGSPGSGGMHSASLSETFSNSLPTTPGVDEARSARAHSRNASLALSQYGFSANGADSESEVEVGDVTVNVRSPTELGSVRSSAAFPDGVGPSISEQ
jgi:hypothetical protein